MDATTARQALVGINLVLGGLFLLMPRIALRLYGLDPDRDQEAAYPVRYVGARLLLIAFLLGGEKDARRVMLDALPVIAATDAGANLLAAMSGEVPKRTVLLGAVTSAAALAVGFVAREE